MAFLDGLGGWFYNGGRRFRDRAAAGQALAEQLRDYAGGDLVVLALPRGGVPVAHEVARALKAPLDLLLVRKLGAPGRRELAMGAIAEGGVRVLNQEIVAALGVPVRLIEQATADERRELERRAAAYRGDRPPCSVAGKTVILIDDGLATGMTMRAAILSARAQQPARIIVAVPVAARESIAELRPLVEHIVAVRTPDDLYAISLWYEDFTQVGDAEVCALLNAEG